MSRNWKPKNLCRHCACSPCQCHTHEQKYAAGKERYEERTRPQEAPKPKKKKTKKTPKLSKKKFIKNYKKSHPTASQSDIKAALKKAGDSTGCAVVAFLLISLPTTGAGYGIYEFIDWII